MSITYDDVFGYTCGVRSSGITDDVVRFVESRALPFGNDWHRLAGARSIKGFALPDSRMALSYVSVASAGGKWAKPGMLMSRCVIVSLEQYQNLIRRPAFGFELTRDSEGSPPFLPSTVSGPFQNSSGDIRTGPSWAFYGRKVCGGLRHALSRRKIVLEHQYRDQQGWTVVEHVIQQLLRLLPPRMLRGLSFTTLTLALNDPSRIIGLPSSLPER